MANVGDATNQQADTPNTPHFRYAFCCVPCYVPINKPTDSNCDGSGSAQLQPLPCPGSSTSNNHIISCPPNAKCYTSSQLDAIQRCSPDLDCQNKFVTVQRPPKLISQKKIMYVEKVVQDQRVVNRMKKIQVPQLTEVSKVVRVPKLLWEEKIVKEPRIIWCDSVVAEPCLITTSRVVCEPKEVCQTLVCQPKPQTIDIPPAKEYCVYEVGETTEQISCCKEQNSYGKEKSKQALKNSKPIIASGAKRN